ncbi:putative ATPase [Pseudomonas hunanensis]|uniref:ATPase n=1 Tax=Pseudomonas hunanensis TaxID=1247546 RepID=A0ACC6K739_9PSED|nr:hypothetical protein [Pseudomonas hunanensis]MDR6714274.1 putative ATPase [Pseudomonas hunanensis]
MPTIMGMRIEDRLLELITPETQQVGRVFEVDSISLLLGKNGSGKTRLLNLIAEAVSAPGRSDAKIYVRNRHGEVSALSKDQNDFCAVYYSGLPYKRRMSRRIGLIDASPQNRNTERLPEEHGRMAQLGEVASALGQDTKLMANLSYSKNIYRAIFIPALLQRVRFVTSPTLKTILSKLKDIESTRVKDGSDFKGLDSELERCMDEAVSFLDGYMDRHFPCGERIHHLAVVEHLHAEGEQLEDEDGVNYAMSLLNYIGLSRGYNFQEGIERIQDSVARCAEAIRNYGGKIKESARSISFVIDGVDQFDSVRSYNTPITIEWSMLSSGLQALVDQFAHIGDSIATASQQGRSSVLLMIDEGDAYLHLDWQRKYLTLLNRYLGGLKRKYSLKSLQVILASHSPIIAADMPGVFVTNLDSNVKIRTFGAPIEEVIAGSFDSSSLGAFAAKKINHLNSRALNNNLSKSDLSLIEQIGDDAIRAILKRGGRS